MTVMMGPLDFFTTSRFGSSDAPSFGAAASLAACWARASGVIVFPVITIAAPMTAFRIMKERRLRLDIGADSSGKLEESTSWLSFECVFILVDFCCLIRIQAILKVCVFVESRING